MSSLVFKIRTIIPSSSRKDIVWIIFSASTLLYEKMWWSWEVLMYSLNKTWSKLGFVKNKSAFSVPVFYTAKFKLWKNLRVSLCDRCFNWHLLHCCSWLEFHLEILEKKTTESEQNQQKITGARTFFWHYHLLSIFTQWKIRIIAFIGPNFHLTTCPLLQMKIQPLCGCMTGFLSSQNMLLCGNGHGICCCDITLNLVTWVSRCDVGLAVHLWLKITQTKIILLGFLDDWIPLTTKYWTEERRNQSISIRTK